MKRCLFCKRSSPALRRGQEAHKSCNGAYGLDYNPTSERDARAFLDRRRVALALVLQGTPVQRAVRLARKATAR